MIAAVRADICCSSGSINGTMETNIACSSSHIFTIVRGQCEVSLKLIPNFDRIRFQYSPLVAGLCKNISSIKKLLYPERHMIESGISSPVFFANCLAVRNWRKRASIGIGGIH